LIGKTWDCLKIYLGMTPSEKAGINLELGNNKWLGLLKKSLQADGMREKSREATQQNEVP